MKLGSSVELTVTYAKGMNQQFWFQIKVTLEGQILFMFEPAFRVCFISSISLKDFYDTWLKCSVYCGSVQKAKVSNFGSRSSSHWKVKCLGQHF